MNFGRLLWRNLTYFWRTNLAVIAGVATGVAVLAGALLVGESVRSSLRDLVLQRLGNTDYVISADRFFRDDLAGAIASRRDFQPSFKGICPVLFARGLLINQKSGLRARNVNVYGVDQRFWKFQDMDAVPAREGRQALIGEALAREIQVQLQDPLLLRIENPAGIPTESLYGHRDDIGRTIRLVCGEILSPHTLSEFSLQPGQASVLTVFVPLKRLQIDLEQPGRVNTLLVSRKGDGDHSEVLRKLLRDSFAPEDLGLRLRILENRNALSVESSRILLEEPLARAVMEAAAASRLQAYGIYTYLANTIRSGTKSIPYSVIAATDLFRSSTTHFRLVSGDLPDGAENDAGDSIWLNEWAQRDLGLAPGDPLEISYYVWLEEGRLIERTARFRLAGVFALEGGALDPALAPEVPGVTDADSLHDWDPPFPIDLKRIRPGDEDYWKRYRTTPKAFILLKKGQDLWRTRFGMYSSIRLLPSDGDTAGAVFGTFSRELHSRLDPEMSGFALRSVKGAGIEASQGSTDFGEYFLYFSFFLIVSAVLLAALFFRLGVEQRVREIGLLRSMGFSSQTIRAIFIREAVLLSAAGSLLGVAASAGYAGLLLFGLRTWWSAAVGTTQVRLHLSGMPLLVGSIAGCGVAIVSVALTLRGLTQSSARSLLTGALDSVSSRKRRSQKLRVVVLVALTAGLGLLAGAALGWIDGVLGFFGAGSLLLVALLGTIALAFRRERSVVLSGRGLPALIRLGARNAGYRPGRSVLCVALIAFATFVIVSLEAFRYDPAKAPRGRTSGTGGFTLFAESVLPLVHNLNTNEGQEAVGFSPKEMDTLRGATFVPFRLRPGDDASCLNLYAPREPRVLGAGKEFLRSGRFSFQESLAKTADEKENPWLLLESAGEPGVIPAIGDANSIHYILHRRLGEELVVRNSRGETARLRLVAALRGSIFQGELLISETNFLRYFPEQQGYRFFLIDVPDRAASEVARVLEEGLADFGFDATATEERLATYHKVESTYLSTFQSLGGLGLVLGTVGLGVVLLRNVLERRQELALLRAVGFRRADLAVLVVSENGALLLLGLAAGAACALLAIGPALISRGTPLPASMLALTLGGVLVTGLGSSLVAVIAAFRSPLLPALRGE